MTAIAPELASPSSVTSSSTSSSSSAPRPSSPEVRASRRARWAGRVLTGLPVLFLLFDASMKLLRAPEAVEGTAALGYPTGVLFGLGVVQLACVVLHLIPRTAVLGALLLTGYLGGAVATHVRMEHPWATHVLFPTYVAALVWAGLWLRDARVRALLPLRTPNA